MNPSLLILPVTFAAVAHAYLVGRRRGLVNIDGVFSLSMWIMTVGTLWVLDDPFLKAPGYTAITVVPYLLYLFSSAVIALAGPRSNPSLQPGRATPVAVPRTPHLLALFILSSVITVAYYYAVGYNTFALGLQGIFTGTSHDYATLRLDSYATGKYLYPGYVNQFKNIIFPTLSLVWIHHSFATGRKSAPATAILLSIASAFALLGTGQRGAFITFTVTTLLFVYQVNPRQFHHRAPRILATAAPPVMLATAILGRTAATGNSGTLGQASGLVQELYGRVMKDNQFSGVMAYRYVQGHPIPWGSEWQQGLAGILPGNPGSTLSNEVFASIYGSTRGTSPISNWGSVYYNFEWFGLLITPLLLALIYAKLSNPGRLIANRNALECAGAAGVAAVGGTWIAGGPDQLINSGLVTYAILWALGSAMNTAGKRFRPARRRTASGWTASDCWNSRSGATSEATAP